MSDKRTQLEHLSVELFRLIFEYLAPHELFQAFDNLNSRFTAILARQPLCLPNNRRMPYELYQNYISKISAYAPRLVYLHLSERYAPHAVDELLSKVAGESLTLPALKAAIIEDLPPNTFISLIEESSLLIEVRSLTFEMSEDCYHYSNYGHSIDMDYLLPVLNRLPNLCSLCLRMSPLFTEGFIDELKSFVPFIKTHPQLHTLSIDECSRQLFAELLGGGYLPKLRRLNVVFARFVSSFTGSCLSWSIDSVSNFLISKRNVSHWFPRLPLCHSNKVAFLNCVVSAFIFTYFENIHGQLEKLKISGHVDMSDNGNLPRLADLRQWLTMSRSAKFTFAMNLSLTSDNNQQLERLLAEYWRVNGRPRSKLSRTLNIRYPGKSLVEPIEWNDADSSDESGDVTYAINNCITKVRRRTSILDIIHLDVHSWTFPPELCGRWMDRRDESNFLLALSAQNIPQWWQVSVTSILMIEENRIASRCSLPIEIRSMSPLPFYWDVAGFPWIPTRLGNWETVEARVSFTDLVGNRGKRWEAGVSSKDLVGNGGERWEAGLSSTDPVGNGGKPRYPPRIEWETVGSRGIRHWSSGKRWETVGSRGILHRSSGKRWEAGVPSTDPVGNGGKPEYLPRI